VAALEVISAVLQAVEVSAAALAAEDSLAVEQEEAGKNK
jgi:hypothetical protein